MIGEEEVVDSDGNEGSENEGNDGKESEEEMEPLIIDTKTNKRLIRKPMVSTKAQAMSVHSKDQSLRVVANAFAVHRLADSALLMASLVTDMRTPHSVIINAALILFTQDLTDDNHLTRIMDQLAKYDINKRELMLEMIIHFIRNNDRIGAKDYVRRNQLILKSKSYRNHVFIDTYLKSYICFIDYMEWKEDISETSVLFQSNRFIAQKTKLSLKNILSETKDIVLDVFVLILWEMHEYYEEWSEVSEILGTYVHNNSDHLNAYIYYYNFSLKYPNYTTADLQVNALKHILKYSPECPLVLELIERNVLSIVEKFQLLMEFIGYKENRSDLKAFRSLKRLITSIEDTNERQLIEDNWIAVYASYWPRMHCSRHSIDSIDEKSIELIECKHKILECFDPLNAFLKESKQLIGIKRRSNRLEVLEANRRQTELNISMITSNTDQIDCLTVRDSAGKGKGVFATQAFRKGDFICRYFGDLLSAKEAHMKELELMSKGATNCWYLFYFKYKEKCMCLDATEDNRMGRLINHSRIRPNCVPKLIDHMSQPYLCFFAVRDINKGEEVLYDYGDTDPESIQAFQWLNSS